MHVSKDSKTAFNASYMCLKIQCAGTVDFFLKTKQSHERILKEYKYKKRTIKVKRKNEIKKMHAPYFIFFSPAACMYV